VDPGDAGDQTSEDELMRCSDCDKIIPEGRQVCLWSTIGEVVRVRFICEECSNKPEYMEIDLLEEREEDAHAI
jgi:hypothetical protein